MTYSIDELLNDFINLSPKNKEKVFRYLELKGIEESKVKR